MASSNESLQTSSISLQILDIVKKKQRARLSEIADQLDMAVSSVHAHLVTLQKHGFIVKDGNAYQLGMKLFHLGEHARARDDGFEIVRQRAHELSRELNEEVAFAVEEQLRTIIVFDETTSPTEEGYQVGRYFYMHNSASGKAILAEWARSQIESVIDEWGLPRETENTITTRDELFDEIKQTRSRGYSVNNQEALEGLKAIGMAITLSDDSVFGSLDISGPPYRLENESQIATRLEAAVDDIETELREMYQQ